MEIKELLRLTEIISEVADKYDYWSAVIRLKNSLTQLKNAPRTPSRTTLQPVPQQATVQTTKANIEKHRILALKAPVELQTRIYNLKELKVFNKSSFDEVFGQHAISLLERIPREIDSNLEGLIKEINEYTGNVGLAQTFLISLNTFLRDFKEEQDESVDKFILFFEQGASIDSLKELSKASSDWNQIVNCFSRLVKDNNTETQILSVERGSLVLTLTFVASIIVGLIKASDKVLDVILKGYEIKKKALELKQLKLSTIDDAIQILEKQAKLNVTSEANIIAQELMEEYQWDKKDNLYNETKTAVNQAVSRMFRFQNSGGKIDAILQTKSAGENGQIENLRLKNFKLIKIEQEVNSLSDGKEILQIEDALSNGDEQIESPDSV